MPQNNWHSLWDSLTTVGRRPDRALLGADRSIPLADLAQGSSLVGGLEELSDRSVLVLTESQLASALALIELDGVARRLVLCPPDLPSRHIPLIIETAELSAVVSDSNPRSELAASGVRCFVTCTPDIMPAKLKRSACRQTEWILLTSGTTGLPKLVLHTTSTLTGAINGTDARADPVVWGTFYDIRRYGGLQIFFRALLGGRSLVLSSTNESMEDYLVRAGACGVTHISGTPSHWRRALISPSATKIAPQYIRLSGEIADQDILDDLRAFFPQAVIVHAFASTEAGLAFEVVDGLMGFPASLICEQNAGVEMTVETGSLMIRSSRNALGYIGGHTERLANKDGFVDTGDMVEMRGHRYYFVGRRDGTINVGGLKVHPEEVEAVINSHPNVRMSLVKPRKNKILGAVVIADVVANCEPSGETSDASSENLKNEILETCRRALAPYKVPAIIRFVPSLDVAPSGKLARFNA